MIAKGAQEHIDEEAQECEEASIRNEDLRQELEEAQKALSNWGRGLGSGLGVP